MKKILSLYQSYMIRPTIYMCVSRCAVALMVLLFWDRFVNNGTFSLIRDGCLVMGLIMMLLSWFAYLSLQGVPRPKLRIPFVDPEKRRRRYLGRADIVDFADEHIVSFDELEPEEKSACILAADFIGGLLFFIPGVIATVMWFVQH
ncbi:MAG: hypothetical protein HFF76_02290 [Oscillospiraceae bacterium]|jgi:hypothetical protein|nr:hypothetical protein [Oscillospiraceae bacterium]